eukprot:CAMPEP_0195053866 /NCGR_PEP_ID=MMETSP0448-20130528/2884_1 /TAXON_ID=66468 /ORGANISM="Heterocapsa triquestra, Strain CCMP 448" /LENGTH=35 /DNA_ID= /DNA_START= /DNA_END= /DNA_ORIENTATION=
MSASVPSVSLCEGLGNAASVVEAGLSASVMSFCEG